ncbi:bacteriocin immunity protein [Lacticaseibacillus hulanensis]|uniref:bacteriocin immunity protein n=1 Tax=Lacticaseibacillus hulanensis TaxID=2493111 RepID=UPI000FD92EDB|nr:bacteriocin immunity protein [Lacticaseibacillus hulanensis]
MMQTQLSVQDAVHDLYNEMSDPASLAMLLKAYRKLEKGGDPEITAAKVMLSLQHNAFERDVKVPDGPALESLREAGKHAGLNTPIRADLEDLF